MKTPSLNYVFRISVLSCSGDGSWIERNIVKQSNLCKSSVHQLACNIATEYLKAVETGIQVSFLGLQTDKAKGLADLTILNPFVVTIKKSNSNL